MYWGIILTLQHIVAKLTEKPMRLFSFDFKLFCAILCQGRTQAAFSSHKKMAPSTFSDIISTKVIRAYLFNILTYAAWLWSLLGRGLQTPIQARFFCATQFVKKYGRTQRADKVASALFYVLHLGRRIVWAISGFPLTAREPWIADALAVQLARPIIQKVRIC